jgi:hypothetical protein
MNSSDSFENFESELNNIKDFQFSSESQKIKALNVIFNFNGHSFDAHEIIGVPAGSKFEDIRVAFNKSIQKNPGQRVMLIAAMSAIIGEFKKSG